MNAPAKRFSDAPKEVRDKVLQLEEMLGVYTWSDGTAALTKPYNEAILNSVLYEINNISLLVRHTALLLVRIRMEQAENLTPTTKAKIKLTLQQLLDRLQQKIPTSPKDELKIGYDNSAISLSKDILWLIQLNGLEGQAKEDFLKRHITHRNSYYRRKSVDYLTEINSHKAKQILAEYLEANKKFPRERRVKEAKLALRKIEISENIFSLHPEGKVGILARELKSPRNKGHLCWIMRKLEKIGNDSAISVLKEIFDSNHYDVSIRYDAQESLKRLKVLPKEVYRFAVEK